MTQRSQIITSAGDLFAGNQNTLAGGQAHNALRATSGTEAEIAIGGVKVPDSKLAHEITELVRDTESPLLFHHSSRVFYWGALTGARRDLTFDAELLYAGAMFHDMGLTLQHSSPR